MKTKYRTLSSQSRFLIRYSILLMPKWDVATQLLTNQILYLKYTRGLGIENINNNVSFIDLELPTSQPP